MAINCKKYIENFIKIRTKDAKIVPFILNGPQNKLYDVITEQKRQGKPVRIIILKARQLGFSTATGGIIFEQTATKSNVYSSIIAHTAEATSNLFNMYKLMYECLPDGMKPTIKLSNAAEVVFDNDAGTGLKSKIRCTTAGSTGLGRSFTLNNLHLSELAFWSGNVKEILLGLFQAVPNSPDTMIIIESTANGYEAFQEMWEQAVNGTNDYYPLFIGWNELPEYKIPYDGFELTDYENQIKEEYELSNDQLMWRRWCIANNCGGDVDKFNQEYPICPEDAFISTGNCMFNQENLIERLKYVPKPIKTGQFEYDYDGLKITNWRWVDNNQGPISIFREPEEDMPYVIGCDTAGEGSDYFYAHCIDNTDLSYMFRYRNMTDETMFARQMYCLGMHYNEALINIETNFSTYPQKELERLGYTNFYVREQTDTYTGGFNKSFGFKTTVKTRPVLIGMVNDVIRECVEVIEDEIMLRECLTFVKNEQGRAEALKGKHDDGVMAYGITLYGRDQQFTTKMEKKHKVLFKWSDDLKEDYYKADQETKERIIEKYGELN